METALLSVGGLSLPELREALIAQHDCRATLDALAGTPSPPARIGPALLRTGFAYLVRTGLDAPQERR